MSGQTKNKPLTVCVRCSHCAFIGLSIEIYTEYNKSVAELVKNELSELPVRSIEDAEEDPIGPCLALYNKCIGYDCFSGQKILGGADDSCSMNNGNCKEFKSHMKSKIKVVQHHVAYRCNLDNHLYWRKPVYCEYKNGKFSKIITELEHWL